MNSLLPHVLAGLSPAVTAYFLYRAKQARMKRDEKLIERANRKDMPAIARALNPPHELGPWRRRQLEPSGDEGQAAEPEPQ